MSKYVLNPMDKSSHIYDLCGVINHLGHSLSMGHYTSYARTHDPHNSTQDELGWRLFDDEHVVMLKNPAQIVSQDAYVLMYRLRDIGGIGNEASSGNGGGASGCGDGGDNDDDEKEQPIVDTDELKAAMIDLPVDVEEEEDEQEDEFFDVRSDHGSDQISSDSRSNSSSERRSSSSSELGDSDIIGRGDITKYTNLDEVD